MVKASLWLGNVLLEYVSIIDELLRKRREKYFMLEINQYLKINKIIKTKRKRGIKIFYIN